MLTYHFFPSADQSVANVLQEQIEKHQAEERELVKRRQDLIKAGVDLPEIEGAGAHGVAMPGMNPKDSAETFMRKIMVNQQRMANTIKRYEDEQKMKNEKKIETDAAVDAS